MSNGYMQCCEGAGCRRRTELHYVRCCDAYLCEDCEQAAVADVNPINGEIDEDGDAVGAMMGANE
jgi:hypothetical protein